eukprot:gb/GECH01011197.1/.p1 GENE.gb/GECH01011197.1/~~gb/GECH01011197.1/.p1  ORF type:complete len:286 (+),score=64.12 gb/GECH01011197.1/:1-858(+)
MSQVRSKSNVLAPKDKDIQSLLACQTHIGHQNLVTDMERYIWTRRADGVHIMNIGMTWEKLMLAARIIVGIENPSDVVVISNRTYGHRAVLKFAQYTGAQYIAGRFTPGTFTNQIQSKFMEPRLLIVTDPRLDFQAIKEASYVNIPVIAFCGSDSPLRYVDCAIPANNKGKHSIGLLYWLLAREVLRMRGSIVRKAPWSEPVDLFFYKDPREADRQLEAEAQKSEQRARKIYGGLDALYSNVQDVDEEEEEEETAEGGWDQGGMAAGSWANTMENQLVDEEEENY